MSCFMHVVYTKQKNTAKLTRIIYCAVACTCELHDTTGTIASAQPVIPNSPASDVNQNTILYKEGELDDGVGFYTKQQHVAA